MPTEYGAAAGILGALVPGLVIVQHDKRLVPAKSQGALMLRAR
jgi:hypothetical protein